MGAKAVEVGGLEMTSTQLVAATAVATLLSIAAVAERKALKRYSRQLLAVLAIFAYDKLAFIPQM